MVRGWVACKTYKHARIDVCVECMYVCNVRMYVCMYARIYVCMDVHMYAYMYACIKEVTSKGSCLDLRVTVLTKHAARPSPRRGWRQAETPPKGATSGRRAVLCPVVSGPNPQRRTGFSHQTKPERYSSPSPPMVQAVFSHEWRHVRLCVCISRHVSVQGKSATDFPFNLSTASAIQVAILRQFKAIREVFQQFGQ